ncbi:MAG: hypothetical protein P4L22_04955 [Candidatus Babeliales bacterium]|nr:hypothetical protein [Candidatus Babeliales bacterium]
MLKKTFLKLLVICLFFGHTPQIRSGDPVSTAVGLTAIIAFPLGFITGISAVLCYGLYSLCRASTEKELLESNIYIFQKLEKYYELFELIKQEDLNDFTNFLKIQKKINNKTKLNIFLSDLKNQAKKLKGNIDNLNRIIKNKNKKKENLGIHDMNESVNKANMLLEDLSELQSFISTNKTTILIKIK